MNNFNAKEIRTIFLLYQKVNYNNPVQIKGSLELMEQRGMLGSPQGARFKQRLYSFCDENNIKDMSCVFCGNECINRKGLLCASCEAKFQKLLDITEAKAQAAKAAKEAQAAKKAQEAKEAEEASKAQENREAEEAPKAQKAKKAEEASKAQEAREAEEASKAQEAREAEEASKAQEAKEAEEASKAQEAKKATAKATAEKISKSDEIQDIQSEIDEFFLEDSSKTNKNSRLKNFTDGVGKKLKTFGKTAGEKINLIGTTLGEKVSPIGKAVVEKVKPAGKAVGDGTKSAVNTVGEKIKKGWAIFKEKITALINKTGDLFENKGLPRKAGQAVIPVAAALLLVLIIISLCLISHNKNTDLTAGQSADSETSSEVSSLSGEEPVELLSYVNSTLEEMEAIFGSAQPSDVEGIWYFKNIGSSVVVNSESQTISYIDLEEGGSVPATIFGIKCGMTREEILADFDSKNISDPSASEGDNDYYFFQFADKDCAIGLTINYSDNKAALISVMIINQ